MFQNILKIATPYLVGKIILFLLGAVLVFHLTIVLGLVPYDIVWGGHLGSKSDMYALESVSIVFNLVIMLIVAVHVRIIRWRWPNILLKSFMWLFSVLFLLNTLGNIMAETVVERVVFTPLTIILCLLFLRLTLSKE